MEHDSIRSPHMTRTPPLTAAAHEIEAEIAAAIG